jgi:hypothetical protein
MAQAAAEVHRTLIIPCSSPAKPTIAVMSALPSGPWLTPGPAGQASMISKTSWMEERIKGSQPPSGQIALGMRFGWWPMRTHSAPQDGQAWPSS